MSTPATSQPQGVTVVGPDQKKYQFPAGTTKEKAVAYFKSKGIGVPQQQTPAFTAPNKIEGLTTPGNINLGGRPILKNPDGSVSTERSFSIGTDKGEVLIPRIFDGKDHTEKEAIEHYRKTGQHMGIFDTPGHADAYAQAVHSRSMKVNETQTQPQNQNEVQLKPFAAPSAENLTAKHAMQQGVQGLKELGSSVVDVGKDLAHNPNWVFGHESVFQHVITDPAGRQAMEANAAWKLHQYDRAGIHEIAGALPLVGPWVGELYEQSVTGDPLGAVAKGGTQALAAEATGRIAKGVKEAVKDPKLMARQLEVKASHPEISDHALDKTEMAEAGRAMAESKVIAGKLTLPRKLDQIIKAKGSQVDQIVAQADKSGATADVSKSLETAVDTAKQRAAALGDQKALSALDKWKLQQSATLDPKTKTWTPRNMTKVMPSQLLRDSRLLEHDAGWEGGQTPESIKNAAKLYRQALNDHLDTTAPGTAKLRSDVSQLIKNREGALEMAKKSFMGSSPTFVSYFRSPGTLGAYALLKGLGFSWIGAIAPVVGLKTLWDSTLSRTARAAILQRAGEIIDGGKPSAAAGGGQPAAPPTTPQTPQTPPTAPSPQGAPPAMQSPQGQLPPAVQQAVQTFQQAKQLAGPTAPIEQVVVAAQKIKAVKALQAAVGPEVAQSTPTANVAPSGPANAANPLQGNNLQPTAPPVAKIPEGVSGVGPKAKALLDRLDELTQRVPKSGKDRQDIAREIEDIKKAAGSDTSEADRKAITERIQARERQQKHRAKAQAETPGATSTGAKEPTTKSTPESQTMLIDAGLNKLSQLGEIGRNAAKNSKREAIMRKWSFAEHAAQITEQIEFLSSHPELTPEDVK